MDRVVIFVLSSSQKTWYRCGFLARLTGVPYEHFLPSLCHTIHNRPSSVLNKNSSFCSILPPIQCYHLVTYSVDLHSKLSPEFDLSFFSPNHHPSSDKSITDIVVKLGLPASAFLAHSYTNCQKYFPQIHS